LLGLAAGPLYNAVLGQRAQADLSTSDSVREATVPLAIELGLRNLAVGIGDGNFPRAAANSSEIGVEVNTHNDYLRAFAEWGLVATAALLAMIFWVVRTSGRREQASLVRPTLLVFLVALLAGNLLGSAGTSGGFWVLLGTAASLPLTALANQRERPVEPQQKVGA